MIYVIGSRGRSLVLALVLLFVFLGLAFAVYRSPVLQHNEWRTQGTRPLAPVKLPDGSVADAQDLSAGNATLGVCRPSAIKTYDLSSRKVSTD